MNGTQTAEALGDFAAASVSGDEERGATITAAGAQVGACTGDTLPRGDFDGELVVEA